MTLDQILEVITAYRDGGHQAVQYRTRDFECDWLHPFILPGWDFSKFEWRITPSHPKPREFWIAISARQDVALHAAYEHLETARGDSAHIGKEREIIHVIEVLHSVETQTPVAQSFQQIRRKLPTKRNSRWRQDRRRKVKPCRTGTA